jgi:hypothetical protein
LADPVVLVPGRDVTTLEPSIDVAGFKEAGQYLFTLTVIDQSEPIATGQILVTVKAA